MTLSVITPDARHSGDVLRLLDQLREEAEAGEIVNLMIVAEKRGSAYVTRTSGRLDAVQRIGYLTMLLHDEVEMGRRHED